MKTQAWRAFWASAVLALSIGGILPANGQDLELSDSITIVHNWVVLERNPSPLTLAPGTARDLVVNSLTPEIPATGSCTGSFTHTLGDRSVEICAEYSIAVPSDAKQMLIELELPSSGRNLHFVWTDEGPITGGASFWTLRNLGQPLAYRWAGYVEEEDLRAGTWYFAILNFENSSQSYAFTVSLSPVALSSGIAYQGSITDNTLGGASTPSRLVGLVDYTIHVPSSDKLLRIRLENRNSAGDIDLAVRYGQPVIEGNRIVYDFLAESTEGIEIIEISSRSSPPLRSGTYHISVLNNEATRQRFTLTATIQAAPNTPPQADFTFSPSSPTTDDTVQFTDRSSDAEGAIARWEWNFGDGSTSSQQNPTHRYTQAGTYTVSLKVTDGGGLSDTESKSITVQPPPNRQPTANAGQDQTVKVGDTVQLNGSASSDPDGDPLSFRWRFTQRPTGSQASLSSSTTAQTTFVPDMAGQYIVELTVDDGRGGTDSDTVTITAQEIPTYPYTGNFTLGQLGQLAVPQDIRSNLPQMARFVERPNTTHQGQRSDSLAQVGLSLNPTTGTIFGTPTQAGQFRFLIEVQDQNNKTAAFLLASVTIGEPPEPQPSLVVTPTELSLSARVGDPNPSGKLTIQNMGGGILNWTARTDASWLTLNPAQGTLSADESQEMTVTATLTNLAAGTYQGNITVEAPNVGMVNIRVTLQLESQGQPTGPLSVNPASLSFSGQVGGQNPERQELLLTNTGNQSVAWAAAVEGDWLYLSISSGTLPPGERITIQVWPEIGRLNAGTYQGKITFSAPRNPEIQPVIVPVALTLTGPTPTPGGGELLALKFIMLEFLKPADWERALRDGCVVYENISTEPSSIRVTLIDSSTQEFAIPSGNEVIVCGDVVHIDTRR